MVPGAGQVSLPVECSGAEQLRTSHEAAADERGRVVGRCTAREAGERIGTARVAPGEPPFCGQRER